MRRKLIEIALPLDEINAAGAREKSIRHGHPSTLHLWWSRKPLAVARAVIFGQLVDDPSSVEEEFPTPQDQAAERERLFDILRQLVLWENTGNETVLEQAREEIRRSWRRACADNADHPRAAELFDPDRLPAFHDPFAGGGALPLEAQRLGLEAHASDLNPVAVLINKAMIEIPPKFAGRRPVNPGDRTGLAGRGEWPGAAGLAADVRHYGRWMRDEAEKRIGHLYPKAAVTAAMAAERPDLKPYAGRALTVIAWLWARTARSPNPAFADVEVPLASSFVLSSRKGKEAYVEPVIKGRGYRFVVRVGKPKDPIAVKLGTTAGKRKAFRCVMSGVPITYDHIRSEGKAGRMGARLMAIVAEGNRGRVYITPTLEQEAKAREANPQWVPDLTLPDNPRDFKTPNYGMPTYADLFTDRQLVALTTFSDLVAEVQEIVLADARRAWKADDGSDLAKGGAGALAYAQAVGVYLAFAVDKVADRNSAICTWASLREHARNTFGRQAIPMMWDFAESNPFSSSSGNFIGGVMSISAGLGSVNVGVVGSSSLLDVQSLFSASRVISTDPPYYDNIGYADLSDFFYVWLRRSLKTMLPDLFATLVVPKVAELIASPYRHGSRNAAESFFLSGMARSLARLAENTYPGMPTTVYYAYKQSEMESDASTVSTGWEIFLKAIIDAGFTITGTWPMRTELKRRMVGMRSNALASSIVLVCRRRREDASLATRREFTAALRDALAPAVGRMQSGNIAPVDLAQAAIGPGMAVYTRYAKVLDASGKPMTVRDALALINQILDEVLAEQEGDFDADSRWALAWFEECGFNEGEFGSANTLATAKNTSIAGMVNAGILVSRAGKVRLLSPKELPADWDPRTDSRLTSWEMVHHLIRVLEAEGNKGAARLVRALGGNANTARELCYRLYALADRKNRSKEALDYNSLVSNWPSIAELASSREFAQVDLLDPDGSSN